MSKLAISQHLIIFSILVALILSGCGIFSAPASEETGRGDYAAVGPEKNLDASSPSAGELAQTEEMVAEDVEAEAPPLVAEAGKVEVVAGGPPVEEAIPALGSDEAAAVDMADSSHSAGTTVERAEGGGSVAVAATAMPLPTGTPAPSPADADASVEFEADGAELSRMPEIQQAEPLKAGEVDDNSNWDEYLLYRRNYRGPNVHERDISERYIVEVVDGQGRPVLGANVRFYVPGQPRTEIYSARTYSSGRALFHPRAMTEVSLDQVDNFIVEVQKNNLLEQFAITRYDAQAATSFTDRWTVSMDLAQQRSSLNLDVLFLVDATGSMADEIAKIQNTIFDVSARIDALPENPDVRYGMVTYRDRGDSFVTNSYDFTPDVRDFAGNLNTVFADGGGDYPEALNEALHEAIHSVEWRGGDTVQLIFLIADAPPHLDYAQDYDYAVEMEQAAQRGIKIFPIASSGLDDQGEYIFRQIAQYTEGRFIFLTYEGPTNGGAPGAETTHHVDDYSVENLDDLLVRLVEEELNALSKGS
jgi:Mg-chelatase subunit ChlD